MSIMEILIRSISGYIFIIPGIILYFGALRKSAKRQILLHITTAFIFCYYLIDMISGPIDTILNIILFVPLGFFLPLLYKKYGHIGSVALVSFLLSLSIEIVQMFGRGATDINDLITNTVGACLGFFIYQLLSKLVSKELCRKFQSYNINEGTELLFFIIYSFVIMVTIQPIIISTLFHLA